MLWRKPKGSVMADLWEDAGQAHAPEHGTALHAVLGGCRSPQSMGTSPQLCCHSPGILLLVQEVRSELLSMPTRLFMLPCGRGVPLRDAASENISFATSPNICHYWCFTSNNHLAFSPCQLLSKSVSLHDVGSQKGLGWKSILWQCPLQCSVGAERVSNLHFYL